MTTVYPIKRIVIHCSATPPSLDIGAKEIDEWHKARGWKRIGYNYVIRRDGRVEPGRAEGEELAHAAGYNRNAIVSNYMSIAPRSPGDDPWYDGGYGEVNGRTRALDSILRARQ